MTFILFLLLVLLGPPAAILVLGTYFNKLSHVAGLTGRARQKRLVWLAVLASGLTSSLYFLVIIISAKLPGAHAAARSSFPWLHEHPLTTVLLVSLGVTLLLVSQPAKRPAGLSFGAGALVVLTGLGIHWFFTEHQEDVRRNASWQLLQSDIAVLRKASWFLPIPGYSRPLLYDHSQPPYLAFRGRGGLHSAGGAHHGVCAAS